MIVGILPSTITFTVNSHADNDFYKYFYLFQVLCSLKSVFLIKHTLSFGQGFLYSNWFKCETPLVFFLMRAMAFFVVDCQKIIELHIAHTWRHM